MSNEIIMLDSQTKTGTYSKGPNQGQPFAIAVGKFAGPSGRIVSRIIPNPAVADAFKGRMVAGKIAEATVQPYSFQNAKGETVNTNKKWVVQFDGESLEAAIRAHGKKAATVVVETRATADVSAE